MLVQVPAHLIYVWTLLLVVLPTIRITQNIAAEHVLLRKQGLCMFLFRYQHAFIDGLGQGISMQITPSGPMFRF